MSHKLALLTTGAVLVATVAGHPVVIEPNRDASALAPKETATTFQPNANDNATTTAEPAAQGQNIPSPTPVSVQNAQVPTNGSSNVSTTKTPPIAVDKGLGANTGSVWFCTVM